MSWERLPALWFAFALPVCMRGQSGIVDGLFWWAAAGSGVGPMGCGGSGSHPVPSARVAACRPGGKRRSGRWVVGWESRKWCRLAAEARRCVGRFLLRQGVGGGTAWTWVVWRWGDARLLADTVCSGMGWSGAPIVVPAVHASDAVDACCSGCRCTCGGASRLVELLQEVAPGETLDVDVEEVRVSVVL